MKTFFLFLFVLFYVCCFSQTSKYELPPDGDMLSWPRVTEAPIGLPSCCYVPESYDLRFEDNFSGVTDPTGVDCPVGEICLSDHWKFREGTGPNPEGNIWYPGENSDNYEFQNGNLHLISEVLDQPVVRNNITYLYETSSLLSTNYFGFGRYELRCSIPEQRVGLWPAFWLFGGPNGTYNEIDMFEFFGTLDDSKTSNLYKNILPNTNTPRITWQQDITLVDCPLTNCNWNPNDFNNWVLEWEPHKLTFLLNNIEYRSVYKYYKLTVVDGVLTNVLPIECTEDPSVLTKSESENNNGIITQTFVVECPVFPVPGGYNIRISCAMSPWVITKAELDVNDYYPNEFIIDHFTLSQKKSLQTSQVICGPDIGNPDCNYGDITLSRLISCQRARFNFPGPTYPSNASWSIEGNYDIDWGSSNSSTGVIYVNKIDQSNEGTLTVTFTDACGVQTLELDLSEYFDDTTSCLDSDNNSICPLDQDCCPEIALSSQHNCKEKTFSVDNLDIATNAIWSLDDNLNNYEIVSSDSEKIRIKKVGQGNVGTLIFEFFDGCDNKVLELDLSEFFLDEFTCTDANGDPICFDSEKICGCPEIVMTRDIDCSKKEFIIFNHKFEKDNGDYWTVGGNYGVVLDELGRIIIEKLYPGNFGFLRLYFKDECDSRVLEVDLSEYFVDENSCTDANGDPICITDKSIFCECPEISFVNQIDCNTIEFEFINSVFDITWTVGGNYQKTENGASVTVQKVFPGTFGFLRAYFIDDCGPRVLEVDLDEYFDDENNCTDAFGNLICVDSFDDICACPSLDFISEDDCTQVYELLNVPLGTSLFWEVPSNYVNKGTVGNKIFIRNISSPSGGILKVHFIDDCGNLRTLEIFIYSDCTDDVDDRKIMFKESDVIKLFPNPTFNSFSIDVSEVKEKALSVEILSLNGKRIKEVSPNNNPLIHIDSKDLKSGVYLVKVNTLSNTYVLKLFKSE